MNPNQNRNASIPFKGNLTPIYILSIIIAILMAAAAIAGLLYQTITYPSDDLLQSFLPTDLSILFIGLPMLLGSMWLTRRGKLVGLLFWPGALLFTLYSYLTYTFAMPLNAAFLLHLVLVAMSVYTLIALLSGIDTKAVQQRLSGAVPERLGGGILAGLGLIFFLRAIIVLISALASQTPMAETVIALNISDTLTAPAWIICGLFLWKRTAFGYVTGLGMLFQGSMLFIGLIIIMLLQPFLIDAPVAWVDVLVIFVMGFICFVPFALFLRGVVSERRTKTK